MEKAADHTKPAPQRQAAETIEHAAKGALGEKKPVPEAHLKNAGENSADGETSVRIKKRKKRGVRHAHDPLEGTRGTMGAVITSFDNSGGKQVRAAVKELYDLLNNPSKYRDRSRLKKALEHAALILEKQQARLIPSLSREQAGAVLASMKDMLAKLKQEQGKSTYKKESRISETQLNQLKQMLPKMESMAEGRKGEGFSAKQGNDGPGGSAAFGPNAMKNDISIKRANTPDGASLKNSIFRESIENMIQNARVVVKDSDNASFSIRLHPRELGSVNINLGLLDGTVHGKFLVESQEAKEALLSNLDQIKNEMREAGISVGEFQVNVSDQRERLMQEARDFVDTLLPPSPEIEVEKEYRTNAQSFHDGHVNVLI
jgi:hypothetical protein